MKHWNIRITGKVQGVYFRLTTKAVADQLGVKGFVRNEEDGSVYIEAEGDDFTLDALLDFCKEGPDGAEVENVSWVAIDTIEGFKDFTVRKRRTK